MRLTKERLEGIKLTKLESWMDNVREMRELIAHAEATIDEGELPPARWLVAMNLHAGLMGNPAFLEGVCKIVENKPALEQQKEFAERYSNVAVAHADALLKRLSEK